MKMNHDQIVSENFLFRVTQSKKIVGDLFSALRLNTIF